MAEPVNGIALRSMKTDSRGKGPVHPPNGLFARHTNATPIDIWVMHSCLGDQASCFKGDSVVEAMVSSRALTSMNQSKESGVKMTTRKRAQGSNEYGGSLHAQTGTRVATLPYHWLTKVKRRFARNSSINGSGQTHAPWFKMPTIFTEVPPLAQWSADELYAAYIMERGRVGMPANGSKWPTHRR